MVHPEAEVGMREVGDDILEAEPVGCGAVGTLLRKELGQLKKLLKKDVAELGRSRACDESKWCGNRYTLSCWIWRARIC